MLYLPRLLSLTVFALSYSASALIATSGNEYPNYQQEMKPIHAKPSLSSDSLQDSRSRPQMTKDEAAMQVQLDKNLKKKKEEKSQALSFEGSYAPVP